jgi:antitoxin CcdA
MRIMSNTKPPRPPKKPVNLTINSDLLADARALNINLSATMEAALTKAVKQKREEIWLKDNEAAISAYNERMESAGVFSDGLRTF